MPVRLLSSILLVLALAQAAYSQSQSATVTGIVFDPGGAAVPGALIQLVNQETGESWKSLSNDSGVNWTTITDPLTSNTSGIPHLPRPFFAEFVAPHDPNKRDVAYIHVPPQRIHLLGGETLSIPLSQHTPASVVVSMRSMSARRPRDRCRRSIRGRDRRLPT